MNGAGDAVAAPETLTIPSRDGFPLVASRFHPADGNAAAPIVLINAATGVKRGYYRHFAAYLAADGFEVLTYDYRGIGDSRPASLRGFAATMAQWGTEDLSGVLAWLATTMPARPVLAVGHSVGGQIVGLTPENHRLAALYGVAAQCGYWGLWPAPRKYMLLPFWFLLLPSLTALLGYFPSSRLGLGEDLPAEVAREWARWCGNRRYMVDRRGAPLPQTFDRFTAPLCALSFADDVFAPRAAVARLVSFYTAAPCEHRHLAPGEVGVARIGHFGFFQERFRDTLWQPARAWLRAHVP